MKTQPIAPAFAPKIQREYPTLSGLTKREYFAAAAMQGLCANESCAGFDEIALDAVKHADALIAALNK